MIYGTVCILWGFDVNRRPKPLDVQNRIGRTESGRYHDLKRSNGRDADLAQVHVSRLAEEQGAASGARYHLNLEELKPARPRPSRDPRTIESV